MVFRHVIFEQVLNIQLEFRDVKIMSRSAEVGQKAALPLERQARGASFRRIVQTLDRVRKELVAYSIGCSTIYYSIHSLESLSVKQNSTSSCSTRPE